MRCITLPLLCCDLCRRCRGVFETISLRSYEYFIGRSTVNVHDWHAYISFEIPIASINLIFILSVVFLSLELCSNFAGEVVVNAIIAWTYIWFGAFLTDHSVDQVSSVVECRTCNRKSPFRNLGNFVLSTIPQFTSLASSSSTLSARPLMPSENLTLTLTVTLTLNLALTPTLTQPLNLTPTSVS